MAHRQRLLDEARRLGATHIGLLDADEVLTGNWLPNIREQVDCLPPGSYLRMPMPNLWGAIDTIPTVAQSRHGRHSVDWARAVASVAVAMSPALAWRARGADAYDHHGREPIGSRLGMVTSTPGLMHLQFANRRRLVAKHVQYKIQERLRWPNKPVSEIDSLYNLAIKPRREATARVPEQWWEPYADIMHHLDMDSEPWQERENERLIAEHGREKFAGLDLFDEVLV
jgi:hypothetical protein